MLRVRARYFAAASATIVVGLFVHLRGAALGPVTRDVLGDALWAAMIAWLVGAIAPNAPLLARAIAAYSVCEAVEVGQLYHSPALDAVRATFVGHLVLGSGFDARDFASYAAGVICAALLEMAALRNGNQLTTSPR